jgi:vacuolar-type H+-ATPase subunit E/Vma4
VTDQEEKLQREILAEAERKAKRLRDRASQEAKKLLDQAAADAAQARAAQLAAATAEGEARARAIAAGIRQEARRQWLLRRENHLRDALAAALAELEALAGDRRADLLETLAAEALAILGADPALEFAAPPPDAAQLTPERLATAARRANLDPALAAGWRVVADPALPPGLAVRTAAGRLAVDQSFRARLERLEPALRARLAAELGAANPPPNLDAATGSLKVSGGDEAPSNTNLH